MSPTLPSYLFQSRKNDATDGRKPISPLCGFVWPQATDTVTASDRAGKAKERVGCQTQPVSQRHHISAPGGSVGERGKHHFTRPPPDLRVGCLSFEHRALDQNQNKNRGTNKTNPPLTQYRYQYLRININIKQSRKQSKPPPGIGPGLHFPSKSSGHFSWIFEYSITGSRLPFLSSCQLSATSYRSEAFGDILELVVSALLGQDSRHFQDSVSAYWLSSLLDHGIQPTTEHLLTCLIDYLNLFSSRHFAVGVDSKRHSIDSLIKSHLISPILDTSLPTSPQIFNLSRNLGSVKPHTFFSSSGPKFLGQA